MKYLKQILVACLLMLVGGGFVYLVMENKMLKQQVSTQNTSTPQTTITTTETVPNTTQPNTTTPETKPNTTQTPDVTSTASPSRVGLKVSDLDQYLLDYATYEYQYKVNHNYIRSLESVAFTQGCTAPSGKGAIYDINYTNRRGTQKQEYFFVGVYYNESADGTLSIRDVENDNDNNLNEIYAEAWDEGFNCE